MITLKKIFLLIAIFAFSISSILSQDVIHLSNRVLILANNITIKPDSIVYTDFNDPTKTPITISKSVIKTISYKDGSEIKIVNKNRSSLSSSLPINIISFHLFDLVISNFTLSYERIFSEGKFGIQIPISIGYKDGTTSLPLPPPIDNDYTNELVSKFYSGINLNLYPTGQGNFKYFLGPAVHMGSGTYFAEYESYNSIIENPVETNYAKLLLNNGIIYSPVESLSISVVGAIGIQHMFNSNLKKTETTGGLSINLSLRF